MLGALVMTGCTKGASEVPTVRGGDKIPVTITAKGDDGLATRTYAYMDGTTFRVSWNTTDQLGVFGTYNGTATDANAPFTVASVTSGLATFTGTLTDPAAGADVAANYYAYYPFTPSANGAAPNNLALTLPAQQTPSLTTFDGKADILLGIPVSVTAPVGKLDATTDLNFTFSRPVAVGAFGVSNVPSSISATDYVQSVTLTFDKPVAGSVVADITAANPTLTLTGTSNSITLNYAGQSVPLDGNFKIWWTMFPQTISSMKVDIETGSYSVTKTISSSLAFAAGKIGTATLNLATNTTVLNTVTITPTSGGWGGSYVAGYTWTQGGFDFTSTAVMKGAQGPSGATVPVIQGQASNMILANTSGFSQIAKIVVDATTVLSSGVNNNSGNLVLYVGNAPGPDGTTTPITPTVNGAQYTFTVTSPAGQQAYFTFRQGTGAVYLNDIVVYYIPGQSALTTPAPKQSNAAVDSYTVSWPAVNNATGGYLVSTDNGVTWDGTQTATQTATSFTATGLTASTPYTVMVKAVGDGVNFLNSPVGTTTATTTSGGTQIFRKVTSAPVAPADFSGSYLIVSEAGIPATGITAPALLGTPSVVNSATSYYNTNATAVTSYWGGVADGTIKYNATTAGFMCTIAVTSPGSGIYTIKDAAGNYLGYTSTSATGNYLQGSPSGSGTSYQWSIVLNADNSVTITSKTTTVTQTRVIWFNNNSGAGRFATYTSTTNVPIQLYVLSPN